jgi:hypothetical protein
LDTHTSPGNKLPHPKHYDPQHSPTQETCISPKIVTRNDLYQEPPSAPASPMQSCTSLFKAALLNESDQSNLNCLNYKKEFVTRLQCFRETKGRKTLSLGRSGTDLCGPPIQEGTREPSRVARSVPSACGSLSISFCLHALLPHVQSDPWGRLCSKSWGIILGTHGQLHSMHSLHLKFLLCSNSLVPLGSRVLPERQGHPKSTTPLVAFALGMEGQFPQKVAMSWEVAPEGIYEDSSVHQRRRNGG